MHFQKFVVFINSLVPLALLAYDAWRGRLGANPVEFFLRTTGVLTLIFLVLSLSVTPARRLFGWNEIIRVRRMLGLFAFFYACLHLVTYSFFDKSFAVTEIAGDIAQRPFIAVGMAAFAILVPLAATSTNRMIKRLGGRNWARLHRLSYGAAVLGVLHFWMIVKSDVTYPVAFALAVAALLGYRAFSASKRQKTTDTPKQAES
jgi:sulfoxide reductase heme-binding subunit YedZ